MLYLPAFRFEDHEVRLPSPPGDILRLWAALADSAEYARELESVLVINPSLLISALQAVWSHSERAVKSFSELTSNLERVFFNTEIESAAFDLSPAIRNRQLHALKRWLVKPTFKRMRKFIMAVSGLDFSAAAKLLSQIVAEDFEVPGSGECQSTRKASMLTVAERWISSKSDDLPIRQVWLAVTKLQMLESKFDCELQQQKLQAMKQLAYGASHEINNPLANIATRAQSLMSDETNPSRRQRLSIIYAQAMRAHEMISDMMLFAHPPALHPEPVEPRKLVDAVLGELRKELVTAEIDICVRQYPNVPFIELDITQLAVALKAMLQNAIHAIGSRGEIRVQIWRREEHAVCIAVADNGTGVDPEIAKQIFDPFFSGREAGRGLGFGLSKAWRIVQLHGGNICLDPDHAPGARFVMSLPLTFDNRSKPQCSRIDMVRAA